MAHARLRHRRCHAPGESLLPSTYPFHERREQPNPRRIGLPQPESGGLARRDPPWAPAGTRVLRPEAPSPRDDASLRQPKTPPASSPSRVLALEAREVKGASLDSPVPTRQRRERQLTKR